MKYHMDNGMWWGLIKDGNLVALKRSSIEPATFDFGYPFLQNMSMMSFQ